MLLIEQYLLSAMLEYHSSRRRSPFAPVRIGYLFPTIEDGFAQERASELGFTHLAAATKRNRRVARSLERRVQRDLPEHYERCFRYVSGFRNARAGARTVAFAP
jgi:hypothetical protein